MPFARGLAPCRGDDGLALARWHGYADLALQAAAATLGAGGGAAGAHQGFKTVAAGRAVVVVKRHGEGPCVVGASGGGRWWAGAAAGLGARWGGRIGVRVRMGMRMSVGVGTALQPGVARQRGQ